MDLIDWLIARRDAAGMTDSAFAERLGLRQSTWTLFKQRRRGVSRLLIQRALAVYPTLREEVLRHAFPLTNVNDAMTDRAGAGTAA